MDRVVRRVALLVPSAFARDPDPLVTNGKRLATALHKLEAMERDSAPRSRVIPLLRTLVEEDSKHASRHVALARRKCATGQTSSASEATLLSRAALGALRVQVTQVRQLLDQLKAGESVTLGGAPVQPPALWPILAWVRREIAEIQGASAGGN